MVKTANWTIFNKVDVDLITKKFSYVVNLVLDHGGFAAITSELRSDHGWSESIN
jgi:hypothetical protein